MMPAPVCLAMLAAVAAYQEPAQSSEDARDEIVVTGERVRRSLHDTSSSVAVVSQADIEANGANDVDQILSLIPNVQLGNGSQGPASRGLDSTGPLPALPALLGGNRPRTTIIVDGRPVTYNELVFGTFGVWDVDRIEVFRSPQTTTQGQNSIAGAIFVNTNLPTFSPEYRARGIIGNFKTRQISALASGPVSGDGVAFRIAGDFRYARTTSHILDDMAGADPNHDVFGQVRAKLLVNPGPATRLTLTYAHLESQAPQIVGVSAPFRKRRDEVDGYGIFRVNVDSLTAAIRHEASSTLTASVLLTAGASEARRFALPGFGQTRNNGRDWSGEAIAHWTPDGTLTAIVGISHSHVRLKQFINLSLLSGSIGRFHDWQDGTGIFADLDIALSARAKMTLGMRYQRDRQKREGALTADTFIIPVDFIGTFDAWLPKVTLSYDLTPELRVGAMVQKAYNPGGTTIRVDTGRPDDFKAETLWDYEVFARAELADGRATATANLFYYDMRNAQRAKGILVFTPSGRPAGFANLFNVPKARSYGAEGQLTWRANEKLSGTLSVGFLGSKVVETDAESTDLQGKEFDRSAHFSAAAAIAWRPTDRLQIAAQARHHSPYFTDPENTSEVRVGSATTVDARAEYRLNHVTIFAQIRNVFGALNMLDLADPHPVTGEPLFGEAEDPRMIAVGLETRF
jgi:outer membrane receptor protein involved in Fe transport